MERKITLIEAKASDAIGLTISCAEAPVVAGGCRHEVKMGIDEAIERWGGERRLDALPLVCSRCGGRTVDVRPDWGNPVPGGSVRA